MKLDELDLLKIGNTIQIAGAVYAGEGQVILAMFPDEGGLITGGYELKNEKGSSALHCLNMDLDDWTKFLHQTDVLETEIFARAADGKLARAIARKSQRLIAQGVSWAVYRRDNFLCRYCGADDVPLTVDHLVLWEEGGPSIESNLVSSCRKDNKVRGNLPYAEWLRHPRYLATSKNLTPEVRAANEALVATLEHIPRTYNQRSR